MILPFQQIDIFDIILMTDKWRSLKKWKDTKQEKWRIISFRKVADRLLINAWITGLETPFNWDKFCETLDKN